MEDLLVTDVITEIVKWLRVPDGLNLLLTSRRIYSEFKRKERLLLGAFSDRWQLGSISDFKHLSYLFYRRYYVEGKTLAITRGRFPRVQLERSIKAGMLTREEFLALADRHTFSQKDIDKILVIFDGSRCNLDDNAQHIATLDCLTTFRRMEYYHLVETSQHDAVCEIGDFGLAWLGDASIRYSDREMFAILLAKGDSETRDVYFSLILSCVEYDREDCLETLLLYLKPRMELTYEDHVNIVRVIMTYDAAECLRKLLDVFPELEYEIICTASSIAICNKLYNFFEFFDTGPIDWITTNVLLAISPGYRKFCTI